MSTEAERKLIQYLFDNYTKEVRPVDKHNETLCLEFGIAISQLHEVVRLVITQFYVVVSRVVYLLFNARACFYAIFLYILEKITHDYMSK